MNLIHKVLLAGVLSASLLFGRESDPTLVYRAYGVPWNVFPKTEDGKVAPGINRILGTDTYDVRGYLETQGVQFQEGGEAIYFPSTKGLLLKNDAASNDLVESLLGAYKEGPNLCREMGPSLILKAYRIPKVFFSGPEPEKSAERVEVARPIFGTDGYDARDALKSMGMTFPTEGEAIYFPYIEVLLLRNTEENHDLLATKSGPKKSEETTSAPSLQPQ